MTDFAQELRHRCRNPKCRMKLKVPAANPHHAFCTPGCYSSFYLKRCVVCENPKPDSRSNRKFCRRPGCRSKYAGNRDLFELSRTNAVPTPALATDSSRSAHSAGIKSAHDRDRPWRLAAGPKSPRITANHYHCAIVPDGSDCEWAGGEWRRIDGRNRSHMLTLRENSRPSYVLSQGQVYSDWKPCMPASPVADDLSIPDFLRR
jgi:hypothetical protein